MTYSADCLSPSLLLTGMLNCWGTSVKSKHNTPSHKSHSFPVMESQLEAGVGGGSSWGLMYEGGSVSVCLFIMFSLVVIAQFEDFTRIIWESVGRNLRPVHNDYIRITRGFNCGLNPVATKHNKQINTCSACYLPVLTQFANIIRELSRVKCLCPWIFYVRVQSDDLQ